MAREEDSGAQSDAYENASMRYMVNPEESGRLGDRISELDSVYDSEVRRLGTLLAQARRKLFGTRSAGEE